MSAPCHVYAAVLHPEEPRLWLVADEGWHLPQVTLAGGFFAEVAPLCAALQARYRLRATVLRTLAQHHDRDGAQLLTLLEATAGETVVGRWASLRELDALSLPVAEWRALLRRALEEDAGEREVPSLRPPWARRGWLEEAETWLRDSLRERGERLTGPPRQIKQWAITAVLRAPSSVGTVFFKAVPPLFAREPEITQALAARFAEVPKPLAVDHARGWTLLGDFGGALLRDDPSRWPEVLGRFAAMQVAAAPQYDALLRAGCADRRSAHLQGALGALLLTADELRALTADERARLAALEPVLRADIACLQEAAVPETLVHGDFHGGNVALSGDRVIVFDWTDAAIAHPFMDLAALVYLHDAQSFTPAFWEGALARYLAPWTAFAPEAELRALLPVARRVALLYHAFSYNAIGLSQETGARWELGGTVAYLFRKLLEEAAKPPEP